MTVAATPADIAFARRLAASGEARRLRESIGLTIEEQRGFTPDFAVNKSTISRWERGLVTPRISEHAAAYARVLRRTIETAAALREIGR